MLGQPPITTRRIPSRVSQVLLKSLSRPEAFAAAFTYSREIMGDVLNNKFKGYVHQSLDVTWHCLTCSLSQSVHLNFILALMCI